MTLSASEQFNQILDSLDERLFRSPEEQWLPLEFLSDPCATFRELRDRLGPVFDRQHALDLGYTAPNPFLLDESKPIFFALSYDAAVQIFHDGDTFSNTAYLTSVGLVFGQSVTITDGAEHARYRALLQQGFKRSMVERWGAEIVRPLTEHLVSRLQSRGGGDLVLDLAAPVPFKVMTRILGLADEQLPHFIRLTTDLLHIGYDFAAAFAAKDELGSFFLGQIEERRSRPTDDLISALAHAELDGEKLSDESIIANLRQLLPAGIETTYRSVGNMWVQLLTNRAQFEAVVEDPALVPAAVEESLRIEGPAFMVPRLVTRDTELEGVRIPAGAGVLASMAMANRDPSRWEDPDRFDVRRAARPHVAFLAGPHTCLGLHLARLQMQTMLREVTTCLPAIRLAVPPEDVASVGFMLRSPARCPVVF